MNKDLEIICPVCHTKDVSKPKYSARAFAISILLIGFPLPFIGRTYHCFDCGLDFKKKDRKNKFNRDKP